MNNSEKECLKIENLKIGNIYANKTIKDVFKCSNQGGMRRSNETDTLVLFSNHKSGIYDDRWEIDENGESIIFYTGMGQKGDQTLDGKGNQNRTLYESNENKVNVHLFETFNKDEYIYI